MKIYCHNQAIHQNFSSTEVFCPFCNLQISKPTPNEEKPCCKKMNVISDRLNFCRSCGTVHGAPVAYEYIDFYENMYKIKKKSIYHRKYHIQNILINITEKPKNYISNKNRNKILKIFNLIDKFGHIQGRKRLISMKFLLQRIFYLLNIKIKLKMPQSEKLNILNIGLFFKKNNEQIQSILKDNNHTFLIRI